jgi:hypothetical protein
VWLEGIREATVRTHIPIRTNKCLASKTVHQ